MQRTSIPGPTPPQHMPAAAGVKAAPAMPAPVAAALGARPLRPAQVLALQRTIGNRAVMSLLPPPTHGSARRVQRVLTRNNQNVRDVLGLLRRGDLLQEGGTTYAFVADTGLGYLELETPGETWYYHLQSANIVSNDDYWNRVANDEEEPSGHDSDDELDEELLAAVMRPKAPSSTAPGNTSAPQTSTAPLTTTTSSGHTDLDEELLTLFATPSSSSSSRRSQRKKKHKKVRSRTNLRVKRRAPPKGEDSSGGSHSDRSDEEVAVLRPREKRKRAFVAPPEPGSDSEEERGASLPTPLQIASMSDEDLSKTYGTLEEADFGLGELDEHWMAAQTRRLALDVEPKILGAVPTASPGLVQALLQYWNSAAAYRRVSAAGFLPALKTREQQLSTPQGTPPSRSEIAAEFKRIVPKIKLDQSEDGCEYRAHLICQLLLDRWPGLADRNLAKAWIFPTTSAKLGQHGWFHHVAAQVIAEGATMILDPLFGDAPLDPAFWRDHVGGGPQASRVQVAPWEVIGTPGADAEGQSGGGLPGQAELETTNTYLKP